MTENKDKINVAPRFPKGKKRKKEEIEILAKARLKKRRPKLTKKRVFIPAIAAVLLIMLGFYAAIMSTHYQSTDDAFVEGRIISVAPRVAGPVVNLLVDAGMIVPPIRLYPLDVKWRVSSPDISTTGLAAFLFRMILFIKNDCRAGQDSQRITAPLF